VVVRSHRAAQGGRPEHVADVTIAMSRLWEPPDTAHRPARADTIDVRQLTPRARAILDIRADDAGVVVALTRGGRADVEIVLTRDEARQLALELFDASGP